MSKNEREKIGRGIDTVYRIILRNYVSLIRIADGKANIIISINSLILSILIASGAVLVGKDNFEVIQEMNLIWPLMVFMFTILSALLLAIVSVIPKIQDSCINSDDVKEHRVSLIFYNHFLSMSSDAFVNYMRDLKEEQDLLYDSLSRDLYSLGILLRKKYRLLNVAYWMLISGWVLTIITFVLTCQ